MRRVDRGRWTRLALGVGLGLVFFAGWLVVLGAVIGQGIDEALEPFEGPAVWSREDWSATPTQRRGDMAHDFAARDLARGLTRDELVAMLGEPDEEDAARLVYGAGWHELIVTLDEAGTVTDSWARAD